MSPARILIIADRPVTLAVVRELLAHAGFSYVTTRSMAGGPSSDGDDCRNDLVLLDVSGPDFDDAGIAPLLRSLGGVGHPPVLALAGEVSGATLRSLAAAGVSQVLGWPDEKAELGSRVGEMLGFWRPARRDADAVVIGTEPVKSRPAEAPEETEASYRLLFTDAPAPLFVVSRLSMRLVAANDAATNLTGYTLGELLSLDIHDLFLDGHTLVGLVPTGSQRGRGRRHDAHRLLTRAGHVREVMVTTREHTFMGEEAVVLHIDGSRERGGLDHILANRLLRDSETGLGGPALFHSRLERAVAARGAQDRIAVLLIALDDVGSGADPWGPRAGDEVLMHTALVIRDAVRASDTPAYLGDGRFAVLLEDLRSPSAAPTVAQRLLDEISRPASVGGGSEVVVGARLGLAFGDQVRSPDELLWRAEQAVTVAKEHDPPALVLFHSPLEGAVRRHTALARDLREAVEDGARSVEDGTLRVVYQPQVEIATRRVVGVEALVRWSHPVHGEVPPETFIPIAEDVGLIAELDSLVLRRTLSDAHTWGFADLPLAVNVSGVELQDPAYADGVIELLASAGDGDVRLELEITERVALQPSLPAEGNVARLRAAGVAVSIDDFGTGLAALTTLRTIAASRIKIDRSFIAEISSGEARAVAGIVAMARGLGMDVIAEGVETPDQCAFLVGHGCLLAQGYMFAPPISASELVRYVAEAGTALVGRAARHPMAVTLGHG